MGHPDKKKPIIKKPILAIFYETFVSKKLQDKLRAFVPIVIKWIVGFVCGIVIGFLLCYLYFIVSDKKEFDWKIITGVFATLGAIITAILLNMTNFMRLVVDKARYHLKEMEFESKNLDRNRISDNLAKQLLPLLNKKLFHADTIFELRARHYAEEKECIARNYIKLLSERINSIHCGNISNSKGIDNIIVILDSGTTVAQIFDELGKESYSQEEHWSKKPYLQFYTNSIRGVLHLFKFRDHNSRYSEIPFPCNIFPGKILSPFEAIADSATIKSIMQLTGNNNYIIFITTGNYLICNTKEKIVAPIARAGFHPYVKAAGYYVADEVHLIAPLGKILINSPSETNTENIHNTLNRFNNELGYTIKPPDESKGKYSLIEPKILLRKKTFGLLTKNERKKIDDLTLIDWAKKTVLFTTCRTMSDGKRYKFHNHSAVLERKLNNSFNSKTSELKNNNDANSYIKAFEFKGLPIDPELQVKHEVPHDNLRKKEKLHLFFELDERK